MEVLAYRIKQRHPGLFTLVDAVARGAAVIRFRRRLRQAQARARVRGVVRGNTAMMRLLTADDVNVLHAFLNEQSEERLRYFRPHGFQPEALRRVLNSGAFLNYGLFVRDRLAGYALLKISPTGSAFIGLLLGREWTGLGLGQFLVAYLYWQASLTGLRARSTISRDNQASVRSHEAVAPFRIVAELPNNYLLIEFPVGSPEPPTLMAEPSFGHIQS